MQEYNKILDRVYELEGLLLLALSGDNNTARLPELIEMKAKEIAELSVIRKEPDTEIIVPPEFNTASEDTEPIPLYEIAEERKETKREERKSPSHRVSPIFSLNDHYLYIRELFGGNANAYNSAMNTLATLENYEEAEEYFIDEYDWDMENETVESFLANIAEYFRQNR